MNPETAIQRRILLAMSEAGSTVFRNETGRFWAGKVIHQAQDQVTLANSRMVPCGLCKGSTDIIGWTPVTITYDMIGKTLAVFTAPEVKTAKGRATKEQIAFIDAVQSAGGIAGIVRSPEDALALLSGDRSDSGSTNN